MDIYLTYYTRQWRDGVLLHGACLTTSCVDTDDETQYYKFCNKVCLLLNGKDKTKQHTDLKLWVNELDYPLPNILDPTPQDISEHIERCVDNYEAFYVE